MLSPLSTCEVDQAAPTAGGPFQRLARRRPFLCLFGLVMVSNAAGSVFSFFYNTHLIVDRYLDTTQKAVFWDWASPIYNFVAYPTCLGLMYFLLRPLMVCRCALREGRAIPAARLEKCRRRLVNLPFLQVSINFVGWLPGMVFFPWMVCGLGGSHNAGAIWGQFTVSFLISALFTTVQTFFIMEAFLIAFLYHDFFQDGRPADVKGVVRIPFGIRLALLWTAVAVMPLVALLAVALNVDPHDADYSDLRGLAALVAVCGVLSGGFISFLVGKDLFGWLRRHGEATEQIARENFDTRVPDKRPDEWGRLSDRFNDMAMALGRARAVHETFGQVVGPEVRDEIMERYHRLGGQVQEVTVLFADIRGFTRRSSGERPERVVELLNRFLTLAVEAVEDKRGLVNKFLGDGIMALFGAPRPRADHADLAVASALDMLARLEKLNEELAANGQAPLVIGVGLHTGPALVGCVGSATLDQTNGRERIRKEFTAIGETVNLCQRIEQLTKTCGGPILLSDHTRSQLKYPVSLVELGPQTVPGCEHCPSIYRVVMPQESRCQIEAIRHNA
jgi:adenylate cyclase